MKETCKEIKIVDMIKTYRQENHQYPDWVYQDIEIKYIGMDVYVYAYMSTPLIKELTENFNLINKVNNQNSSHMPVGIQVYGETEIFNWRDKRDKK